MGAQKGHFERAGLGRLADAVAAVLDLCEQADASLRSAVPMSAAESIIETGDHTIKVGKVRRAISKALVDAVTGAGWHPARDLTHTPPAPGTTAGADPDHRAACMTEIRAVFTRDRKDTHQP